MKHITDCAKLIPLLLKLLYPQKLFYIVSRIVSVTKFISRHIKSQLILPVTQHMSLHIHGGCRIGNHVTYFLQIEVLLSEIIFYSLYAFGTSKRTSTAKKVISLYWFNYSLDRTLIQLVSVATFDI